MPFHCNLVHPYSLAVLSCVSVYLGASAYAMCFGLRLPHVLNLVVFCFAYHIGAAMSHQKYTVVLFTGTGVNDLAAASCKMLAHASKGSSLAESC